MDHLIYITAVFVLAGAVKGITGMGLPTVAVALLSLVMRPVEAAALLVVPSLFTNVWQLLSGAPVLPLLRRLWPMMAGICVGTLLAGMAALDAPWAVGALGVALVAYALLGLTAVRWRVAPGMEGVLSPLAGAATGALSAATGVFVVPAVPYLQALDLDRDELVQAMGLSFTVSTVALAIVLAAQDAWQPAMAGLSFLAQLPALAGMLIGQRLRRGMPPALFRRGFLLVLMVLGMHLVLRWAWH